MIVDTKVLATKPEHRAERKREENRTLVDRPVADNSQEQLLYLQQTVGNKAVQRRLLLFNQSQPTESAQLKRLTVGCSQTVQRFSAEPHEEMTASALRGAGYSREEMTDIQLGNWATDMNQISEAAPYLQEYLGIRLTPEIQFQLVQLLAVGHFGAQAASRMKQPRLGTYLASEHFDNPAGPSDRPEQSGVVSHITEGIGTIERNLTNAITAGRTSVGLQHYGRAMHITQDFFAHTNFVRIAMRLLNPNPNPNQPAPYGGAVTSGPDVGRYRLTSGIFEPSDTIMSILHLLIEEINKEPVPGRTTSGDRIILMIVNQHSPALGRAFQTFLDTRNAVSRTASSAASAISDVAELLSPSYAVYNAARDLARHVLEAGLNRAMSEIGERVTGTGAQPSHTRMNIDDPASGGRLYPIARALATHVVSNLDPLLQRAWDAPAGRSRDEAQRLLFARLREFLVHPEPQQNRWWEPIVSRYLNRR